MIESRKGEVIELKDEVIESLTNSSACDSVGTQRLEYGYYLDSPVAVNRRIDVEQSGRQRALQSIGHSNNAIMPVK